MARFFRIALPILALVFLVAAASYGAEVGADGKMKKLSVLDLIIIAGPIEWAVLLPLSVICYSLSIQWVFTIKRDTLIPPGMADEIHNCFTEGVTDEAVESARNVVGSDQSMLGNIIAAALDKKDFGYEAMKEAAEAVGVSEHNKYISKVSWISMFSSSATLLGLLGTVCGIIGSFLTMAANPGGVDPNMLAANIGEALVCTATGLIIAVGGLYFFFFLRSRVNQAAIDAGVIAHEVLDYFRPQPGAH